MKEYHIKENLCSGGFRIEDANGLHMFDVEGPCCMHVDEFVVVDSQGYKKARIEQNSFWSRSYCIYDDGWLTYVYREDTFSWFPEKYRMRGEYTFTRMVCGYRVHRNGSPVAKITWPSWYARRVLVHIERDHEDTLLLLCGTVAVWRMGQVPTL